jgi:hypothetical protein
MRRYWIKSLMLARTFGCVWVFEGKTQALYLPYLLVVFNIVFILTE